MDAIGILIAGLLAALLVDELPKRLKKQLSGFSIRL